MAVHRIFGVSAITALTVQSTQGVRRVEPVPTETVRKSLECLTEDIEIAGAKIGMLATSDIVVTVAQWLRGAGIPRERVVLDPVLRSSSGKDLLEAEGVEAIRRELLPFVGWVTPNLDELHMLVGGGVAGREEIAGAARRLAALAPGLSVVVTGGDVDPPDDFLLTAAGEEAWFPGHRVETTSTHGTGCVFSSALLCRLLAGDGPAEAVRAAKEFVTHALKTAAPVGKGKGPAFTGDLRQPC